MIDPTVGIDLTDSKPELREVLRAAIGYYLKEHDLFGIFQKAFVGCSESDMNRIPHIGGTKTRREPLDFYRVQLAQHTAAGIYLESLFKGEDRDAEIPRNQASPLFSRLRDMSPEQLAEFVERINNYAPVGRVGCRP